ncbi:MAG: hypothetical protein RM022_026530 [Nostoc sp. EfeVER01]|uniref:hypothetical protein n=2 Tax=unclassified Nostoc TaxID=2593658 RepID=UPI00391A5E1B
MYNQYDDLSFSEQLHLTEEEIRRRHNHQMFLHRNAQMLQQELDLEDELLAENPELAQAVHAFNMQEILAQQQGSFDVMQGDSTSKGQSVWSKFFPGLGKS